jgi:Carboxypeptidase regulatory-like domain
VAKRRALSVFLLVFSLITLTFAQTASTSLRGTITDPTGAVVPGASITLTDSTVGTVLQATSGANGEYQFNQIPPARYTIKVSASGFADQTKLAELLVNQPATVSFTMSVQASAEVVNVSAEAQTLNITDASMGDSVNNTMIQALPSEARNVPDLLSLQPGVLYLGQDFYKSGDSRTGSVNGGRSDQGNITVDGLDDNDQVNGYAFAGVLRETQDSVQEFRVTTAAANADAGRSSGAQVSMVTKSGTNQFHGGAYEYHRPTFTVANDWFNKEAQLAGGLPNIPGKLIRNTFGAALGGPILKDKLFFFGNYEGQRQAENQQVTRTVPTAAYRSGILTYIGTSGNPITLSPSQVAQLDSCSSTCPWGPGPDPNALAYFSLFPVNNGFAAGDGYNTGSYSFSSPAPVTLNTSIGRVDYNPSAAHRLFIRGNLQKDTISGIEQFPGQGPSSLSEDNTKGLAGGDTWSINPNMVNDIRYGYIRQGNSNRGVGQGDYVSFRFMDTATAHSRSTIASVPVHNIVDNFTLTKNAHTISIGVNWRLIHNNRGTDSNSYSSASSNPYWLGGNPPDPTTIGAEGVNDSFGNSYQIAYANLIGTVPSVTNQYNYAISSPTEGTLLNDGAFINRHFKANEFEYYLQDSWKIRPNFTLTFGLRHTILQTPYETNGQQVVPTVDTHSWFLQRQVAASQGAVYEPDMGFSPGGKYFGKPGYWPKSKTDIAPRLAIAWSPDSKTSVRAGFGMFYDHYGQGIVNSFDQLGSFGVSTSLTNAAGVQHYNTSPRFTGEHDLPVIGGTTPPPSTTAFPYFPPGGSFLITHGVDSHLKTPYSETFNLSIQRETPGGFSVEVAYVGRLGRRLLQQLDLAEPVNYVDPKGAGDYFTAGTQLSKLVDQNGGDASASVPTIPYFEDVFPYMANIDYMGESATQAIYTNEWAPYRSNLGATTSLADIDFYSCGQAEPLYPCPYAQPRFWQNQFSSLYSWASIGSSYYNSGQIILRHPSSHGLAFDFAYTFSKSIDMGSDSERSQTQSTGTSGNSLFSYVLNTWKPEFNRAVSDFDTRHIVTVDWVYQLPFGRGKQFGQSMNRWEDALVGGWQWSGLSRWSTALPFGLSEPGWTTNWEIESYGVVTGKVKLRKHIQGGVPQVFDDPDAINAGTATGSPIRLPYPGEAGQRNNFRGDGVFGIDSGLAKTWGFGEYGALKFAWEVFNATNSVRFNDSPFYQNQQLTSGPTLGVYSGLLSTPRRMQFSLRYDF